MKNMLNRVSTQYIVERASASENIMEVKYDGANSLNQNLTLEQELEIQLKPVK